MRTRSHAPRPADGSQSHAVSRRGNMLCLPLLLVLLAQVTHPIRTAYVTRSPSLTARLDRFYEQLEKLTVAPSEMAETTHAPDKRSWLTKFEKFKAMSLERLPLSADEEELLSAMQTWGSLSADQLHGVAKDLQRLRDEHDDERGERLTDPDYVDMDDNDEEYADMEYHNDGEEDEDPETSSALPSGVTPSAYTKEESYQTVISAVGPIAATNERPRILDDSGLTAIDKAALRSSAYANMGRVVRASKCLIPQARWLTVRDLAPASDTAYMPPCVELHRCAPDSGCCNSEAQTCAPVEGRYVAIPLYLHKADGTMNVARMVFYNHTKCACVATSTLQTTVHVTRARVGSEERQNDWRPPPTPEPTTQLEEDVTAPPQMRRCTCPTLFLSNVTGSGCACGCDWRDAARRRECLLFSRGKEHLSLRDRVCIANGDCAPPVCDYGTYEKSVGKCPVKRYRRLRYHQLRRHQEKVV